MHAHTRITRARLGQDPTSGLTSGSFRLRHWQLSCQYRAESFGKRMHFFDLRQVSTAGDYCEGVLVVGPALPCRPPLSPRAPRVLTA